MNVIPIKTRKITPSDDLYAILDEYVPALHDGDVVAVTSKIVSLTRGAHVPVSDVPDKDAMVENHADYFLPRSASKYGVYITVKNNIFVSNAGIDISNGDGNYTYWPDDVQEIAADIWNHLKNRHGVTKLGVVITDSVVVPLRWGTRGVGIAWCGFAALRDYIGTPDAFGRALEFSKASVLDGLSSTAVFAMGEGAEQTPIVHIAGTPNVDFQDRPPTDEELSSLRIELADDLFSPILTSVDWKQGKE